MDKKRFNFCFNGVGFWALSEIKVEHYELQQYLFAFKRLQRYF